MGHLLDVRGARSAGQERSVEPSRLSPTARALLTLFEVLIAVAVAIVGFQAWIDQSFGGATIEQIIFNARQGIALASQVSVMPVTGFVLLVVAVPTLVALAVGLVARRVALRLRKPLGERLAAGLGAATVLVLAVQGAGLAQTYNLADYLEKQRFDSIIDENYRFNDAPAPGPRKQNLVTIYAESLDAEFADSTLYGSNLLADLDQRTEGWTRFDGVRADWGKWTIASIVATQCGIPMKASSKTTLFGGPGLVDPSGDSNGAFLPGAVCLGDILAANGYTNVFLGGADGDFSSKSDFLREHGYQRVLDRNYWQDTGERSFNSWGLSDDRLFERARSELLQLRQAGTPFNLTLLTLDTHLAGERSESCSPSESTFVSKVKCSAGYIADFVAFMAAEGMLRDTTVVIIGDHTHPGNDEIRSIQARSETRSIYNRFYSSAGVAPNGREFTQIDFLPSVLALLGFNLGDGRLALGVSAFGTVDPNVQSIRDIPNYLERVRYQSRLIDELWQR